MGDPRIIRHRASYHIFTVAYAIEVYVAELYVKKIGCACDVESAVCANIKLSTPTTADKVHVALVDWQQIVNRVLTLFEVYSCICCAATFYDCTRVCAQKLVALIRGKPITRVILQEIMGAIVQANNVTCFLTWSIPFFGHVTRIRGAQGVLVQAHARNGEDHA